jgi:hypothetical protein
MESPERIQRQEVEQEVEQDYYRSLPAQQFRDLVEERMSRIWRDDSVVTSNDLVGKYSASPIAQSYESLSLPPEVDVILAKVYADAVVRCRTTDSYWQSNPIVVAHLQKIAETQVRDEWIQQGIWRVWDQRAWGEYRIVGGWLSDDDEDADDGHDTHTATHAHAATNAPPKAARRRPASSSPVPSSLSTVTAAEPPHQKAKEEDSAAAAPTTRHRGCPEEETPPAAHQDRAPRRRAGPPRPRPPPPQLAAVCHIHVRGGRVPCRAGALGKAARVAWWCGCGRGDGWWCWC